MKKAELKTVSIVLVIIIVTLAIIIFGYSIGWSKLLERLNIIIPNQTISQPSKEEFQLLRYNISDDIVEYYDGKDWIEFSQDAKKFGEKTLNNDKAYSDLAQNYYLDVSKRETRWLTIENQLTLSNEIGNPSTPSLRIFVIGVQKQGKISAILRSWLNENDRTTYGELLLDGGNNLEMTINNNKRIILKNSELYSELAPKLSSWRTSIFTKPITINFENAQEKFCPETILEGAYFTLDLSKPTALSTC